jgi:ABC-type multidrug transport system permease subunit
LLRQAWVISLKDTRLFVRDRFALAFALAFPLLFVLGFTLALGNVSSPDQPLALRITTQEQDSISNQIIAALTAEEDGVFQEIDYDEARAAVENGVLGGFVAFPANFTASLLSGGKTHIEVMSRSEDINRRAALEGFAHALAGQIALAREAAATVAVLKARETGSVPALDVGSLIQPGALVSIEEEQVGPSRQLHARNFTLPGYLTMFVFFAAAMGAEAIARERQTQTLERMLSNGVRREALLLGKYLSTAYRGLLQLAVLWLVGIFAFSVALGPEPVTVIAVSVLMVLASAAFGIMLASFVNTVRSADSVGVLMSIVLAPIGGCWWPLFIAPVWMQGLARATPHGWANSAFNKLMLFGAEPGDVAWEMVALALFGAGFVAVALRRFRMAPAR